MDGESDLLGNVPDQPDLFPGPPAGERSSGIDPDRIRRRLHGFLAEARSADAMPWPEREARVIQIIFPQMAHWLPDEEADQLRFEFEQEIERLKKAA